MAEFIKEIKSITFQVASTEDIRNKSVYVANVSKYSENKRNTVYDPRGGALFNQRCETCKEFEQKCPGHFGHIELNAVIVHPIFLQHVFNVLKVICHSCSRMLITGEHLKFGGVTAIDGEKRLNDIINRVKKFVACFHCNTPKRFYKLQKDTNVITFNNDDGVETELDDADIKRILDDIDTESLGLLKMSHPKNCVLEVFPVIPPCCRPYDFIGNTIKEDDLTKQLVDIIKANNTIANITGDRKNAINNLKLKIETFCRTPKNKPRNINSEPIKGIRDRLTGKDGQLRDNLMGKRTEMSGRTVIGPGPNLKLDEVGIPKAVADNLSFPVTVYKHNIEEVVKMIEDGRVDKIKRDGIVIHINIQRYSKISKVLKFGDVIVRGTSRLVVSDIKKTPLYPGDRIIRNGNEDVTPDEIPEILKPDIRVGDVAQRKIVNGDWVLMNRQPTLHKGSMMAMKAVITKNKTFTFNPATCKSYNSDFDGDEMNAHFPQSNEASIELELLSTPQECLLNSANGTPNIVILQDAMLGAYLMTQADAMVAKKEHYNDIIMCLSRPVEHFLKRKSEIEKVLEGTGVSIYSGRAIMSLLFPKDFNLKTDDIEIKSGVIVSGCLTKKYLGSSKSSIICMLKMEYGTQDCVDFINDIQFMTNQWLLHNSFSVNISDCYQNDGVKDVVRQKLKESEFISNTIQNKKLLEAKINLALSNAKDVGMKLADDTSNNFVTTIKAGSKGDYFNLGQVKGLLGQQIINGKRIDKQIDNCTRTLVHYPKEMTLEEEYESRGFIMNSFYTGMNPKEFLFHSISGRQGVCDTAMTTFRSGYIMRKIIKNTEDITIQNDGTVADTCGNIYSYAYDGTGISPESNHNSLARIIDRLNLSD